MNKFKIHTYKSWGDEGSIPISFKKVIFTPHYKKKQSRKKRIRLVIKIRKTLLGSK